LSAERGRPPISPPALTGFRGWALFIDHDYLWLGIAGLSKYLRTPKIDGAAR
jgi:hypothetical protein